MSGTVYALLVGIDEYQDVAVPNLRGCVADVEHLSDLFQKRLELGQFKPKLLCNGEATRSAVTDAFAHLRQAGKGDAALFVYSGHGSTGRPAPQFTFLAKKNETLVLNDSRVNNVHDLADYELRWLLHSVTGDGDGPHMLAILDSCHSGGATREALVPEVRSRFADPVAEDRPLDSHIPELRALAADLTRNPSGEPDPGKIPFPHPVYIALAACQPNQTAKEVPVDGTAGYRGVFSLALEEALTSLPEEASYWDVMKAVRNKVLNRANEQVPLTIEEGIGADERFLGGVLLPRSAAISLGYVKDDWYVDVGQVHGVQPVSGDHTTTLWVKELGEEGIEWGGARLAEVGATRSRVDVGDLPLSKEKTYVARIVGVPNPALGVVVRAHPAADLAVLTTVRTAIATSSLLQETSLGDARPHHTLLLLVRNDLVVAKTDGLPLTDGVPTDERGAVRSVARLEHLARWYQLKDLQNANPPLNGKVEIEVVAANPQEDASVADHRPPLRPESDGVVRLAYRQQNGSWQKPLVFIRVRNKSHKDLYCTLLDLTDRFGCTTDLMPSDLVPAGDTRWALTARRIRFELSKELEMAKGAQQTTDYLKVIAATEAFEPDAFTLASLDGVVTRRQHDKFATGDDDIEQRGPAKGADWTTTMLEIVTTRPDG